jgi:hypothetical protein
VVVPVQPESPRADPPDTIQAVTPTLCHLLGLDLPALCTVPPVDFVLRAAHAGLGGARIDRCLVYAPDAIGNHLQAGYSDLFAEIARLAPTTVALRAVFPPKTPVCFASMFTGAPPADHGIRKYERPVLQCDTLFDALVRAGRRTAIVAVTDSSMDQLFRGRDVHYFSESDDKDVTARTLALIAADRHEFIVVYHQEYDDLLHETTPFSDSAIRAFRNHVNAFRTLVDATEESWLGHDRVIVFAPDHGAHIGPETMTGTHGDDIPQDMELRHFYRFGANGHTAGNHPDASGGARTTDQAGGQI